MVMANPRSWPPGVPQTLDMPARSIWENLAETAARDAGGRAFWFYGRWTTWGELAAAAEALAGWLQAQGVARGDRVLLYMQNAPQFVIAYYAVMRANAVVVPVNPMCRAAELRHLAQDTGATLAICGAELLDHIRPLAGDVHLVAAALADMTDPADAARLPAPLAEAREPAPERHVTPWSQALAAGLVPGPHVVGPDDIALIPYSSGTTGQPKGCVHTHASVMATAWGGQRWSPVVPGDVVLATLPFFHVTGMQNSMNGPVIGGTPVILMARWDRRLAVHLIRRHKVTRWRSITTMAVDLLNDPDLKREDLASLTAIGGGGAAMPAAVAQRLKDLTGLDYVEGYGMSEAMAATHINPPHAAKQQCLGVPVMEVDARVIDPDTLEELGPGEVGEIIMAGPQVFRGYWRNPEATRAAFIERDGKRFVRSGDIGWYDEDGYFWMTDRLKRMVNASGFKVWPAEVEALMHRCPGVAEACVIGAPDPRRGETVKAFVVPQARAATTQATAEEITAWCRANMAAYKVPAQIEIVEELPKSSTGKVLWRVLADRERAKDGA